MERARLVLFTSVFIATVLAGTLGFVHIEGMHILDALYFSIVTISTVGYGDIHPMSQEGKLLAIVIIIAGGGTFFGILASGAESVLSRREKCNRLEKLSMIIGVFFSEVGMKLLRQILDTDLKAAHLAQVFNVDDSWSKKNYTATKKYLQSYTYEVDIRRADAQELLALLQGSTPTLLRLLENPLLLEHETFTELLRSVFHLKEELERRHTFTEADLNHLTGDLKRVYHWLLLEWLEYLHYLQVNYPYLFSYSSAMNPVLQLQEQKHAAAPQSDG